MLGRNVQYRSLAMKFSYLILLFVLYLLAASQAIQSFSYKWTTIAVNQQYSIEKTLSGEAPKPYVYRALMPYIVNFVIDNTPKRYLDILQSRSINTLRANIGDEVNLMTQKSISAYAVIILLGYIFLIATLFALRAITRFMLRFDSSHAVELLSDISPILFALMLSLSYRVQNGFIYDHFEMFCLTYYIFLTIYQRSIAAFLLLTLAILNKETAIFFPFIGASILLAINNLKIDRPVIKKFAIESLVVLCGFLFICHFFRDAAGGSVEFHAPGNMDFWLSTAPWVSITTPHLQLIPLPKPSNLMVFIPIFLTVIFAWNQKPHLIRLPLIIAFAINLPLFFLFSYRDEFRNLSLTFPFVYLAIVYSIYLFYFKEHRS